MTTPTTNLGISAIQAEFGGSSPVAISAYYRGGANVPTNTATSSVDGNPVPTSGQIRWGEFRGIAKVSQTVTSFSSGAVCTSAAQGIRTAQFRLNNDGTSSRTSSFTGNNTLVSATSWLTPTTAGIGSSWWALATQGTKDALGAFTGTYGSWIQLTNGSTWGLQNTSTSAEVGGNITVQLAQSAGGSVVATISLTFDAGYAH